MDMIKHDQTIVDLSDIRGHLLKVKWEIVLLAPSL